MGNKAKEFLNCFVLCDYNDIFVNSCIHCFEWTGSYSTRHFLEGGLGSKLVIILYAYLNMFILFGASYQEQFQFLDTNRIRVKHIDPCMCSSLLLIIIINPIFN